MTDMNNKKEMVEKFRAEYHFNKKKKRVISFLVTFLGVTIFTIGIIMASKGLIGLMEDPLNAIPSWLGGVFITLLGVFLIVYGFNLIKKSKNDELVEYIRKRIREEALKNTDMLIDAVEGKISSKKCEYCGQMVEKIEAICPNCGAIL